MRSLEYALIESFVAIRRNALMSFASIITVALSLGLLGGFVLFALGLDNATQNLLSDFEIQVFVKNGTPAKDVEALNWKIRDIPNVRSVSFISADTGWKDFKKRVGDDIDVSGVQGNPLPDSFRVKVKDPRGTDAVASSIKKLGKIDEVVEAKAVVDSMVHFSELVRIVGMVAAGILFLVMAFIVSNTIRLMIYNRRREIRIMQLVGATNWFIRLPLVFEGTILGVLGAGVACVLVFGGSFYARVWAIKILPLLSEFSSGIDPTWFYGSMVGIGWIVGAIGSLISIQRFLRNRHIV